MQKTQIHPVIHHLDRATTIGEVGVARECGADGVFLISHHGDDDALLGLAWELQRSNKGFPIGINLLSMRAVAAAPKVLEAGLAMLWADDMGVDSSGLTQEGRVMADFAQRHPQLSFFASVAFKYQRREEKPVEAAVNALSAGFVPTTSGAATGKAPDIEKIKAMGAAVPLAVASGMTPENVAEFAPHLAHILVATGVSRSEHNIDPAKLRLFIQNARRVGVAQ
ncbi:BtpA/SgcQ family protein [Ottowia sp.]|uniref:BtpA/SgcQ family protein n=1 Tax=Ottowia sp. TaxID=1898956 RepID=UPI0025DA8076|nr:BtpA/SgcQ family protein [Ottowia sp.]MBK6616517.1 hypothetical protein [Ottowia sp.]